MTESRYLLDVTVLVALSEPKHQHHATSTRWFGKLSTASWGNCAFTEAGFIRVMTNLKNGGRSVSSCMEILDEIAELPGFRYWSTSMRWNALITPFKQRVVGHQQVTDAYLLGLAIEQNGILVTLDKGLQFLAGTEHRQNLLLLTE